jgi:hypothetical protein
MKNLKKKKLPTSTNKKEQPNVVNSKPPPITIKTQKVKIHEKVDKKEEVKRVNEIPKTEEIKVEKQNMQKVESEKVAEAVRELQKSVSKDKIKVFNDDDDSDIEAHLEESRKKLRDPMEQGASDSSAPPTPIKESIKAIPTTDGSVAMSEQALKDAHNYVSNLYGKMQRTPAKNDPFNYNNQNNDESDDDNDGLGRFDLKFNDKLI